MFDFIGVIVPEADNGGACNDFVCEFGHCSFQREIWQEIQNQRIILIFCSILCRIRFFNTIFLLFGFYSFIACWMLLFGSSSLYRDHSCMHSKKCALRWVFVKFETLFDFLFLFSRRWVQKMKKSSQSRIQSSWGNIWKNSISVCMIFQVCILFPFLCEFDAFVRL